MMKQKDAIIREKKNKSRHSLYSILIVNIFDLGMHAYAY